MIESSSPSSGLTATFSRREKDCYSVTTSEAGLFEAGSFVAAAVRSVARGWTLPPIQKTEFTDLGHRNTKIGVTDPDYSLDDSRLPSSINYQDAKITPAHDRATSSAHSLRGAVVSWWFISLSGL